MRASRVAIRASKSEAGETTLLKANRFYATAPPKLPRMSFPDSLDALIRDGTVVWGFLSAVAIVLVLTPVVERFAHRVGALDEPTDRPRVHSRPVPRIGGLAIVAGI